MTILTMQPVKQTKPLMTAAGIARRVRMPQQLVRETLERWGPEELATIRGEKVYRERTVRTIMEWARRKRRT